MANRYTEQEKKLIVQEFLEKYKKNSKLSANKFNTEKSGLSQSAFCNWIRRYDTNNIYKFKNSHDRSKRKQKNSTFVPINKAAVMIEQSVTINIDFMKISIPVNCSKNEFKNILSAIKEIS